MLVQSNMTLLIGASFYINQDYIAKNLCEQRMYANNVCHGQCVLMKKIRAAKEKEQDSLKVNLQESYVFLNQAFDLSTPAPSLVKDMDFSEFRSNLFSRNIFNSLFRPPVATV